MSCWTAATASQKLVGAGALGSGSVPHVPGVALTYAGPATATTVPAYVFQLSRNVCMGAHIVLGQVAGQPGTWVRSGGGAAPPRRANASKGDASFFTNTAPRRNCGQPTKSSWNWSIAAANLSMVSSVPI